MASNVRECDICGVVFKIIEAGYRQYNQIKLPARHSLQSIAERTQRDAREYVSMYDYDVCTGCLIAICKAMLTRGGLEG